MTDSKARKLARKIERSGKFAARIVRDEFRRPIRVEARRLQGGKVVR